jgi:hypothetical protein
VFTGEFAYTYATMYDNGPFRVGEQVWVS